MSSDGKTTYHDHRPKGWSFGSHSSTSCIYKPFFMSLFQTIYYWFNKNILSSNTCALITIFFFTFFVLKFLKFVNKNEIIFHIKLSSYTNIYSRNMYMSQKREIEARVSGCPFDRCGIG